MSLNNAFKQSQQALNNIQRKVKELLEEIQFLDKESVQLDFTIEKMREDYIAELSPENLNQDRITSENVKLEDIAKLEQELKEISLKKVKLAERIEKIVNQEADQLEKHIISTAEQHLGKSNLEHQIRSQHMFQSGLKKHKGRQKNINPEIKAIIKEYYNEKDSEKTLLEPSLRKYCTCKSDKKLQHPESMIECQNSACKIGWFHFECVGISFGTIPTLWYCPKCHIEQISEVNAITYKLDAQQVEVNVRKQEKTDEEEQREVTQIKRRRGRPRKYPLPEASNSA